MTHEPEPEGIIPFVDLKTQFQELRGEVLAGWEAALDGMQLLLGPNVAGFEAEFATYCGVRHAVGVGSGTDALILALRAFGIGGGDEVITTAHTFIATAEAIIAVGARPVLVDVEPETGLMDVGRLPESTGPRLRAVIPVHLYGQVVDMDPLLAWSRQRNVVVIEDACQAHGARYRGRRAGSLGDAGCFSFYFSKNVGAYGDAGAVVTNREEAARRVALLRHHGEEERYHHALMGTNSRLDELQAVVLRVKLRRLEQWNSQRRVAAGWYREELAGVPLSLPVEREEGRHVYHLYAVRARQRDALRTWLAEQGIQTGIHYPVPLHQQPCWPEDARPQDSLRESEAWAQETLSLPMYPEITRDQVARVGEAVRAFFRECL